MINSELIYFILGLLSGFLIGLILFKYDIITKEEGARQL